MKENEYPRRDSRSKGTQIKPESRSHEIAEFKLPNTMMSGRLMERLGKPLEWFEESSDIVSALAKRTLKSLQLWGVTWSRFEESLWGVALRGISLRYLFKESLWRAAKLLEGVRIWGIDLGMTLNFRVWISESEMALKACLPQRPILRNPLAYRKSR